MEQEKPIFLHELRKRPPEKPLTLNELSSLREINHKFLKEDKNALDLLIQYCRHCKKIMTYLINLSSQISN